MILAHRKDIRGLSCLALLCAFFLVGCSDDGTDLLDTGGCVVRIEFDGTINRTHNGVDDAAPRGKRLGVGQPIDCNGSPVAGYGKVGVFAVVGVDSDVAVAVEGDANNPDLSAVYVEEAAAKGQLPKEVSNSR
ncbi:MAG: hypothetical protein ACRCYQ_05920 [Nocardioides sp.]